MALRPSLRPASGRSGSLLAGLGCAPIGNLYTPVPDDAATATIERALERGIRFFDTAPHYGAGESERRLGAALAGVPRDDVVIATKIGRRIVAADGATVETGGIGVDTTGDLTRDGVLRSLEGSLRRLRTDRIDLLHLHDPEDVDLALAEVMPVLHDLRDQGVVRAIGIGMVRTAPLVRFVAEAEVDVVMPAGRLTLLDRSAEEQLLPLARERGVGIIGAGVFNSGILADPVGSPYFDYHAASDRHREQTDAFAEVCRRWGVPLAWAAARFPLRYAEVEGIVVGARAAHEVDDFADGLEAELPGELWEELDEAASGIAR